MTLVPAHLTFISPTISGSVAIAVGGSRWLVAPDSRVVHHRLSKQVEVVLVLEPRGILHALTERDGEVVEVEFPTPYVRDQALRSFFDGVAMTV